jgi:cobaltochelatase CobS
VKIVVKIADRPAVTISRQHYKFPLLLATIAAKVPAFLVGPAGTGKTSAAHAAANALGLPFYAISVGPMTSKSDLFGMRDASGHYHESDLVKAATRGGVFLFDELDAGNAATMTSINMLLANGSFSTPDGMREKSPDFVPVFALNTYGTGASREYVGRNQLDAATLDRGAFLDWPLDASLESSFLGIDETAPAFNLSEGGAATAGAWLDKIRAVRSAAALHKIRHIVSPRAAIYGMQLAAAGVGCKHAAAALLRKGLDDVTAAKLGLA